MVYEGARSVNGPFLKTLSANALIVGFIAGLGEFIGYGIRLVSGYFADRTGAYWVFTFIGYGLLISVPMLALADFWQIAAVLIVLERLGKALRAPAKDTIMSEAASRVGRGFGFGIQQALDQTGAIIGPLIFTAVFALKGSYKTGYAILWIPFLLVMTTVFIAYRALPDPGKLENAGPEKSAPPEKFTRVFWLYNLFAFFSIMGFVSYTLLGYHYKASGILADAYIPLFYSVAMGADAVTALLIGRLYDRKGLITLIAIPAACVAVPFLGFSGNPALAIAGAVLWGVAMGVHETIMKAAIADLTHIRKRGTGYGIFNIGNGFAFLIGGSIMGFLYNYNVIWVVLFCAAMEAISLPVFILMRKEAAKPV
jgi:MFS family permease